MKDGSTENFVKCYYEWLLAVVNPTKCEMHLLLACSFSSFLIKKEENATKRRKNLIVTAANHLT